MTALGSEAKVTRRLATYRVDVAGADGKIAAVFTRTAFITEDAHEPPGKS